MDSTAKVVSALMELGPCYTRISEATGVPISTVRYIVNEKLPKLGLVIKASVDYNMLGLDRYLVFLDVNSPPHHASTLLDVFGELLYLDYYTFLMRERKFLALFVVPPKFKESFYFFLEKLLETGVLRNYDVKKLNFMKMIPLRVECFDFRKGVWIQNWEQVPREIKITTSESNPAQLKINQLDLRILAELQKNVFVKHVDLAKKLGVSRQTIKRHYEKVIKVIRNYVVMWFPPENPDLIATPVIVKLPSTYAARETILNIPFSYMELNSDDQEYYAMLLLPSIGFYRTMKYLTNRVEIRGMYFPSMEYAMKFTVHYNLYKDQTGWVNTFEEGIEKIVEKVKQFRRRI